jgi:hypothetical protein
VIDRLFHIIIASDHEHLPQGVVGQIGFPSRSDIINNLQKMVLS